MSTKDQLLFVALHGTAMRYAAEKSDLAEAIIELPRSLMSFTKQLPSIGALGGMRGRGGFA